MIKSIPNMCKQIRGVMKRETGPIINKKCLQIIDNYSGTDYKELEVLVNREKDNIFRIANGFDWFLEMHMMNKQLNKHLYGQIIFKPLDSNILKSSIGDQSPVVINQGNAVLLKNSTVLQKLPYDYNLRSYCLIFKHISY